MAKRAFRTMLFIAAVALPGSAGHSEERDTVVISEVDFTDHFDAYATLPPVPEPAAGAVDMDTFEPPVEVEPATRSIGSGVASYYGRKFNGRRTANGETFNMNAMTAAHRTLPFGTKVRVTNRSNGRSVVVRINDRGPFHGGRVIDVSRAAATELGLIQRGHGTVELAVLTS